MRVSCYVDIHLEPGSCQEEGWGRLCLAKRTLTAEDTTRQRQNSIHTGFEFPAKCPCMSVFSSWQPGAWACWALAAVMAKAWEKWGCPGAAEEGEEALPPWCASPFPSADGEVEVRRTEPSFLMSRASHVWKVLSMINAQVKDS